MKTVDNRGLTCPQPVINTKKALDAMPEGTLVSLTDNEVARENVLKFARSQGCVAEATEEEGCYKITITKGNPATWTPQYPPKETENPVTFNTLYLIGSDEMGRGGRELGNALMKTFLYSLSESGQKDADMVFINSGVKLPSTGSPALESLKRLQEQGWRIQSCGICLDFYDLKEHLAIGEITNMYSIVELMQKAGKVVTV